MRRCLKVVLKEEAEHHRYAVRDLAALERHPAAPAWQHRASSSMSADTPA